MKDRNLLHIITFLVFPLLVLVSCDVGSDQKQKNVNFRYISGEAQGTTYSITYLDSSNSKFSKSVADSILNDFDMSLSVWKENSTISQFNRVDSMVISDPLFLSVFFRGREIESRTDGAFHPMIMPLVRAWGFSKEGAHPKGDLNTDSLMAMVHTPLTIVPADTSAERQTNAFIIKKAPGQELDVNGIAQGYSVDVLADFLRSKGIHDFMIEVGGEVIANGLNDTGEFWRIGIDKPVDLDEERSLQAIAKIDNRAIATSGSYRKYYMNNGKRYSHTIDPNTGKPVDHELLSTTVLAPNATDADGFATAFMVMGVEESIKFVENNPDLKLDIYLIYGHGDSLKTYMSQGLKEILEEI